MEYILSLERNDDPAVAGMLETLQLQVATTAPQSWANAQTSLIEAILGLEAYLVLTGAADYVVPINDPPETLCKDGEECDYSMQFGVFLKETPDTPTEVFRIRFRSVLPTQVPEGEMIH